MAFVSLELLSKQATSEKLIPHTPQILAFAHQRGTQQLEKVVAFSSPEKSHFKFISIIMSLANDLVRKIYLHTSYLCFPDIFSTSHKQGILQLIKVIIPRAVTVLMALAVGAEGPMLWDAQHGPGCLQHPEPAG